MTDFVQCSAGLFDEWNLLIGELARLGERNMTKITEVDDRADTPVKVVGLERPFGALGDLGEEILEAFL